ncbi:MAG TPA: hypothetical protein VFE33_17695 [Thermoanaerobaculia bacterium]|nr:hypothetical protein [Thermoanaerobaculia bacterium]
MSEKENPGSGLWLGLAACAMIAGIAVAILAAAPILLPAATPPAAPQDTGRGTAVALDGGWLALGARFEPSTGSVGVGVVPAAPAPRVGAVLLFQRSGNQWLEHSQLFAAAPRPEDQFGSAVALRDGVLAVGAPGRNRGNPRRGTGAVYLYHLVAGEWSSPSIVTGCTGSPSIDHFGRSLALDGGWLAVGGLGAVCILSAGDPGSATRLLPAISGQPGSRFGESVALSGPLLAVGAPGRDLSSCRGCGAVDLFSRSGNRWGRTGTLRAPDGRSFDQFGTAVAVSGTRIAVGAPGAVVPLPPAVGRRSGAVYVFFPGLPGASPWVPAPRITTPPPFAKKGDRFGAALAMEGGLLAVGAPPLPLPAAEGKLAPFRPGAAYVFNVLSSLVTFRVSLGSSASQLDLFGAAVAVRGQEVIVGAPLANGLGTNAGAARAYVCSTGCAALGEELPPVKRPPQGTGAPP